MRIDRATLAKAAVAALCALGAWALNSIAVLCDAANAVSAAVIALWAVAAVACALRRRWDHRIVLAGGFAMGFVFVLQLPYNFSWHDLAAYTADFSGEMGWRPDGHLGYIAYIVQNGSLPLMSPMLEGHSVFYHPPLFHLLSALCMRLNFALGAPQTLALENLQLFTWLTACGVSVAAMAIVREAGLRPRAAAAAVIAFQPAVWIFGATLNNDILTVLLTALCMLFTLRWRRTRRMADILGVALSLGLAMATKLNGALIIPCIAVVFAVTFFADLPHWRRYVGQFAAFLAASVPVGVAWPLYHLLAFQMPLNYVRLPAETINVSHIPLVQRFGLPNGDAVRKLFYTGVRKTDHNVWMQTLKTGLFDELTLFEEGTLLWYAGYALLALFAVLLLCALALGMRMLVEKHARLAPTDKVFLGGYAALLTAYYLKFCLDYPYLCTFNFRYIMTLLPLAALAFAHGREGLRRGARLIDALAALFAAGTSAAYLLWFFGVA